MAEAFVLYVHATCCPFHAPALQLPLPHNHLLPAPPAPVISPPPPHTHTPTHTALVAPGMWR
jgi:hypothetical protein